MEEARLLDSLQRKLEGLEAKIRAYRSDLLHDFHSHYHGLLHDVDPDVAINVRRAIEPFLINYPFLRPDLLDPAADPRLLVQVCPDAGGPLATSPTTDALVPVPVPGGDFHFHVRNDPKDSTSREREDDLRGLFTPSYLPFLDGSSPQQSNPPTATIAIETSHHGPAAAIATEAEASALLTVASSALSIATGSDKDHKDHEKAVVAMDEVPERRGAASPPEPSEAIDVNVVGRQGPTDSPSSECSDKSDSKVRKSALRRSSSASKTPQSPRRVRFEVLGAEVLPTASPQTAAVLSSGVVLPVLEDESISLNNILDAELGLSPPPPKISSSEALRALSRRPLEDGTIWTVVNPVLEEDEPEESENQTVTSFVGASDSVEARDFAATKGQSDSNSTLEDGSRQYRGLPLEEREAIHDVDNDSSDDEGDYLSMYNPRSSRNPPPPAHDHTAPQPQSQEVPDAPTMAPRSPARHSPIEYNIPSESKAQDANEDEFFEEEMFNYEPSGLSAPPKPRQQPPPPAESESDGESHDAPATGVPASGVPPADENPYAGSPTSVSPPGSSLTDPTAPPANRFQPVSIGSYKGRPVVMPVVRDPDVYARAASLGKFNTFVGGLDGRSGMDEGDLSSFRNSVITPAFTGEPRSFTERYMMEEARGEKMKETPRVTRPEENPRQKSKGKNRLRKAREEPRAPGRAAKEDAAADKPSGSEQEPPPPPPS